MQNNYEIKHNITYEVSSGETHIYACDEIVQLEEFMKEQDFTGHDVTFKVVSSNPGKRRVLFETNTYEDVVKNIDKQLEVLLSEKGIVN